MQCPIVLLGPERAGKGTVGPLLAEALGLPLVHLWSVCPPYWREIGFDAALQQQAAERGGMEGVYRYMLPFDAHAVQRGLVEHPACVLELGAPQSVYDDPAILAQVRQALHPCENIVLLPSPDIEESFRILEEHCPPASENEFNDRVLAHHAEGELARHTLSTYKYTVGSPSPPKPVRVKLPLPARVVRVVPARSAAKIAWVLYTQPGAPNNWLERLVQIVTQPRPSGQLWVSDTRGNGFHLVGTWPESKASSWVDIPSHFVWMPKGQKISFVHRNALYVVQTE